jgi:mannose-6-phosphate isomerase-like protein (cupin superfamily)
MSNFFVSASDLSDHSKDTPLKVIGANGLLKDKPGFEVDFISNETFVDEMHSPSQYEVNMVMRGEWTLEWDGNSTRISAGDTCLIRPDLSYKMTPIGLDEASLFKVTKTNDPAGSTWRE